MFSRRSYSRLLTLYAEAIERLAHGSEIVRVGAVYSLEHLALATPRLHWTVIETLQSHLRLNASKKDGEIEGPNERGATFQSPRLPEDVQSALTVIGRRATKHDPAGSYVDLSGLRLRGAILFEAQLEGSRLTGTDFQDANLIFADLRDAHLEGADFSGAHMTQAKVGGALLNKAIFEKANLSGVDFETAHVKEACFSGAILWKARLEGAHGLAAEQLADAETLNSAELDASVRHVLSTAHASLFDAPAWS